MEADQTETNRLFAELILLMMEILAADIFDESHHQKDGIIIHLRKTGLINDRKSKDVQTIQVQEMIQSCLAEITNLKQEKPTVRVGLTEVILALDIVLLLLENGLPRQAYPRKRVENLPFHGPVHPAAVVPAILPK